MARHAREEAAAPAADEGAQAAPPAKKAKKTKRPRDVEATAPAAAAPAAAPTAADAAAYLAAHEIVIHDAHAPAPCLSFAAAPFPAPLVDMLSKQPGFTVPSAVQAATWPVAALGRDVLAIAKTGSGKTLGFLLPVLTRCLREKANAKGAPLALIMAPTRELAVQISVEANKYGACVKCKAVAVYGGAAKAAQISALRRGCELIVGTPGRISDVLDVGGYDSCVAVDKISMLVLDEADRMLDMGFEPGIRNLVWHCFGEEHKHQTFLYSATWPLSVQGIAGDLLHDAVKITVGAGGSKLTANKSVTQRVHVVQSDVERWSTFVTLIAPFNKGGKRAGQRVIVFANMKFVVKQIAAYCAEQGMRADSISGDRSQAQREATIRRFKEGTTTVVIATDVAARGLDIKGIECVINYELPVDDFQDYIHRIGRTGRAGATGEADSLFTAGDKLHAPELVRILREAGQDVPAALGKYVSSKITF